MAIAKDVMTPTKKMLSFESNLGDAIAMLQNSPEAFVAVASRDDLIHGVLTEGNLVRIYLKYLNRRSHDTLVHYRDLLEPAQLVLETEAFADVLRKTVTAVGQRVFVMDTSGHVTGFITPKNLLPYLTEEGVSPSSNTRPAESEKADQGPSMRSQLFLYESIFVKSPFMMHSATPDGHIRMANEMLHATLGYEYGELIGRTIFDIYPPENHKKASRGIETILKKGFHEVVRGEMVAKNGQLIEVELVSRALTDENDNPIGTMTISRPLDMQMLVNIISEHM